jgi:hypothetical protein
MLCRPSGAKGQNSSQTTEIVIPDKVYIPGVLVGRRAVLSVCKGVHYLAKSSVSNARAAAAVRVATPNLP